MEIVSSQLGLKTLDDWHIVTSAQVHKCNFLHMKMYSLGYSAMVNRFGSMPKLLRAIYPEHNWREQDLEMGRLKSQQLVYKQLKDLLPRDLNPFSLLTIFRVRYSLQLSSRCASLYN